jgi:hypothetical protein
MLVLNNLVSQDNVGFSFLLTLVIHITVQDFLFNCEQTPQPKFWPITHDRINTQLSIQAYMQVKGRKNIIFFKT